MERHHERRANVEAAYTDIPVCTPAAGHDRYATTEIQLLLSWYFESSVPDDIGVHLPGTP